MLTAAIVALALVGLTLFGIVLRAIDELLFPDEVRSEAIEPW